MIKLNIDSTGSIVAIQQPSMTSVYLDNWALMDIACSESMVDKFITILKKRNGSLEFSGMNLLELSLISDKMQIRNVENFLDRIMPNLSFIDIIPKRVIDRENVASTSNENGLPHCDSALLNYFITKTRLSINPLSVNGFLSNLRQNEIIDGCKTFMNNFNLLDEKRAIVKIDKKLENKAKQIPDGLYKQRATRYIYSDMTNSLVLDNINMKNSNNWRDFFHTIVPASYCDFVLLDRTWANKVNVSMKRLRKKGYNAKMAQVFSRQDIDIFWKRFENVDN